MLPLVITIESPTGQRRRFAFADSPVRIGRSPLAELQLEEPFVSRWQGTLRFDEREVTYCNMSSTNATFLGDREVAAHDDLVIGDAALRLGYLTLRFSREPVPESDLRRKGKNRPAIGGSNIEAKTVIADPALKPPPRPSAATSGRATGQASAVAAESLHAAQPQVPPHGAALSSSVDTSLSPSQSPQPPTHSPQGVIAVRSVVVGSHAAVSDVELPSASRAAFSSSGLAVPSKGDGISSPESRARNTPAKTQILQSSPLRAPQQAPSSQRPSAAPSSNGDALTQLAARHHEAWTELFAGIAKALAEAPAEQRAALADDLQRRFPQIIREPDFRELLKNYGLEPRKIDIPEISTWLRQVSEGILPPKFHLDTGLTLERVLALTEVLSQAFAEINDAQQSVRSRWLGRGHRTSVIKSDDGNVVLAYLLNPKGEWEARMAELEDAAREAVVHEFALFKATLGGARELLESLSPESIAEAEGIDPEQLTQDEGANSGLWNRFVSKREEPDQRLWRRFVSTYRSLMEGERFQRAFLGRSFARSYLAAMGSSDHAVDGKTD